MKKALLIIFACITLLSCQKEEREPVVEKVKMYIYVSNGIHLTNDPHMLEISGTNIETASNITGSYIIEASYPKGQTQTIKVKSMKPEHYVYLQVSKTVDQRPQDQIINTFKQGYLEVSFVAN